MFAAQPRRFLEIGRKGVELPCTLDTLYRVDLARGGIDHLAKIGCLAVDTAVY